MNTSAAMTSAAYGHNASADSGLASCANQPAAAAADADGGGSESVSIAGAHTEPVSFKTLPCEPDKPQTPKQSQKSKTSLSLKWNVSTVCLPGVAPPALTSRVLVASCGL